MVKHPKPAAMHLPKRLNMTPGARRALATLEADHGQPALDARVTRWPCGCTLWYYRVSFGELAERMQLEYCGVHHG